MVEASMPSARSSSGLSSVVPRPTLACPSLQLTPWPAVKAPKRLACARSPAGALLVVPEGAKHPGKRPEVAAAANLTDAAAVMADVRARDQLCVWISRTCGVSRVGASQQRSAYPPRRAVSLYSAGTVRLEDRSVHGKCRVRSWRWLKFDHGAGDVLNKVS